MPVIRTRQPGFLRGRTSLSSRNMIRLTQRYYKRGIKPLQERNAGKLEIRAAINKMRMVGEALLRKNFLRTAKFPAERFFVDILSRYRELNASQRAEAMVNYLRETKKISKQKAENLAITLLESIMKKAEEKYGKTTRKARAQFQESTHKKYKMPPGVELMFYIGFLTDAANGTISRIKDSQIKK